jgi:Flp pilus assembly protein TadG
MNSPQPSSSERGAAAIEFALSVLILFALIFGCIGVIMGFYTYEVVNQYARDATRYAMVHGNGCKKATDGSSCTIDPANANSALKTFLNHQILPGINGNNLVVNTTYAHGPGETSCSATSCNGAGDQVTVQVTYPYLYHVPFIPQRLINMVSTSTMVISQ